MGAEGASGHFMGKEFDHGQAKPRGKLLKLVVGKRELVASTFPSVESGIPTFLLMSRKVQPFCCRKAGSSCPMYGPLSSFAHGPSIFETPMYLCRRARCPAGRRQPIMTHSSHEPPRGKLLRAESLGHYVGG